MAVLEPKASSEVREYLFDWGPFLGDDTIATSEVTVSGITLDSDTNDTTTATYWLSGGTDGSVARVTNTITTAGGRTETEVHSIAIRNAAEPVSLSVAKQHLRVLSSDEDSLIALYITTAREWVETYSGHVLVKRPMTQAFRGWAPYLEIFHRPIVEVTGVAYVDQAGADQVLEGYAQTTGRYPFRIYPDDQPAIADNSTITVSFVAGYNPGEEPQVLVQAMLILIAGMYDNRGSIPLETADTAAALCDRVRAMVI